MYICTECQEKFKTKPEYCTCGNDEFKFVKDESSSSVNTSQETQEENFQKKDLPMKSVFSVLFFIVCIILSVLIWFIKPEHKTVSPVTPQTEQKEMPDFDKIWKEAPIKGVNVVNEVKKPAAQPQNKPQAVQKPKEQPSKPKTQKSQPAKPVQTKPSPVAKPQSAPPVQTKTSPVTKPQPAKPKTNSENPSQIKLPQSVTDTIKQPSSTQTQTTKPAPTPEIKTPQPKPEPPKMNESDFLNYKGAVRSALLANLNVTAIQGSGDCAVEFSVDNSGKLINRNIIYKSTNKTVNDEVYNMLMRLPYYKQPPAHYNGEKIKLKFMFNNGYYEISFI